MAHAGKSDVRYEIPMMSALIITIASLPGREVPLNRSGVGDSLLPWQQPSSFLRPRSTD